MKANMFRMPVRILAVLALAAVCLHAQDSDAKRGRKYKAPPNTSKIEVTVLRATTGKPIENASVVFHELDQNG